MGSKCSILNDTKHDVWITHGVNWEVMTTVLEGLFEAMEIGAAPEALVAPKGEGFFHNTDINKGALENPKAIACLTNATDEALANVLGVSQDRANEIKSKVKEFQETSEKVSPGEKYTFSGSLSLTMRVYVMNDKLQVQDRGCFTGPTAGSENTCFISKHFTNLDIN